MNRSCYNRPFHPSKKNDFLRLTSAGNSVKKRKNDESYEKLDQEIINLNSPKTEKRKKLNVEEDFFYKMHYTKEKPNHLYISNSTNKINLERNNSKKQVSLAKSTD